jgi:hypothetical protein
MLAGLAGQPGLHNPYGSHIAVGLLPNDSAALTASLPTLSRGQMKCLSDFRLVASFYGLHRNDNHPGLAARSVFELSIHPVALRLRKVRKSVPARKRILPELPYQPSPPAGSRW